jgi:hypothetical protein
MKWMQDYVSPWQKYVISNAAIRICNKNEIEKTQV